jgi:hypothetical protein
MAKGHTVYRASCCVPCVKWLNGVTVREIINGITNQLVLERMVWQLVVNGSMGKQKLAERV